MENLHTEDRAAEEILIGCFVECQSIKKVGGRRSVEELYQVLLFVLPFPNVSPSETKIEPDRRLLNKMYKLHFRNCIKFCLTEFHRQRQTLLQV